MTESFDIEFWVWTVIAFLAVSAAGLFWIRFSMSKKRELDRMDREDEEVSGVVAEMRKVQKKENLPVADRNAIDALEAAENPEEFCIVTFKGYQLCMRKWERRDKWNKMSDLQKKAQVDAMKMAVKNGHVIEQRIDGETVRYLPNSEKMKDWANSLKAGKEKLLS